MPVVYIYIYIFINIFRCQSGIASIPSKEGEHLTVELSRTHADKLQTSSEGHLAALVRHDENRVVLRQELQNVQEETERQCKEITRTWESKFSTLSKTLSQSRDELKQAEEEQAIHIYNS